MTYEEKQLLLKDLCARLPYGVKAKITEESVLSYDSGSRIGVIVGKEYIDNEIFILQGKDDSYCLTVISEFVPYLRPMESMTEKEMNDFYYNFPHMDINGLGLCGYIAAGEFEDYMDWLNSHHFDYRGLIEKGLALEAPEGMYNIKNYDE